MDHAAKRQANKFSRQNAALGAETTKYLSRMKLVVVGLRGTGVEIAKNCLLQGVGSLTLFDPSPVEPKDAGANFFLNPIEDAGKPRDVTCRPRLQELNPDAVVTVAEALDDALIESAQCVVITGPRSRSELARWDSCCRRKGVSFIWATCCGLSASVFVDHGETHDIYDHDGEKPVVRLIESITREERGLLRYAVPDGVPATSLPTTSCYSISGVPGISEKTLFPLESNDNDPANTMRLPLDTRDVFEPDEAAKSEAKEAEGTPVIPTPGAVLTEKKTTHTVRFRSLSECLLGGGAMAMTDYAFTEREKNVHAGLVGILEFEATHSRLPTPNDETDAEQVVMNAKHFAEACRVVGRASGDESSIALAFNMTSSIDENFVRAYARHASLELQPVATFCAGVAAQEVVKCAGKYTPIDGFAHFSFMETLPEPPPALADRAPRNSRYDELIAVFGAEFVLDKLANLKYFLVGSGALGCEFVKNFALCGICCGPKGALTIADADRIELSNLTRQFLFREHNVGQPKAVAAAAMAVGDPSTSSRTCANAMNSDLKVQAIEAYVGPKTEVEGLFWDPFWEPLDGVCNALDNMDARFYVDAQCVKFEKPLLESGTMGTSGNVDPIVPHSTRTYRQGGNAADQQGVPMCTLRNFPHLTDHCIEWARDKFAELFVKPARRANKFANDPMKACSELRAKFDNAAKSGSFQDVKAVADEANAIKSVLDIATLNDPRDKRRACAQKAFDVFHALFRDQILDLITAYPEDARVTDKSGRDKGPFWSGHKRFPTPASYSNACESHYVFLVSTTHLLSQMLGGQPRKVENDDNYAADERSQSWAADLASRLAVPAYVKRGVDTADISAAGQNNNTSSGDDDDDTTENKDHVRRETEAARRVLDELEALGASIINNSEKKFDISSSVQAEDFEKDDDYNFHVDFVAACANCRALNYNIKPLTDHDKAKQTAGRIVPAIATTTAAVTGLVMLELFKVVLGMPNTSLRTRQIGLGVNVYPSFDADNLIAHKTTESLERPDPSTLPAEAFDESSGEINKSFYVKKTTVAYPDPHSVWTKLVAPDEALYAWRPSDLANWLREEHGLILTAWNLQTGQFTKDDDDADGKPRPVSTRVYPPVETLDLAKLPPLDLSKPKAMMHLAKQGVKGSLTMKYLAKWDEFKKIGTLPADVLSADAQEKSTADMTLAEILRVKGGLDLKGRRRVLLDGLSCSIHLKAVVGDEVMETDDDEIDVEKLAPVLLKVPANGA